MFVLLKTMPFGFASKMGSRESFASSQAFSEEYFPIS